MKKEDIPVYNDPEDFINRDVKYPCDTQYMIYDPLVHKYFLTPEGLSYYGIDAERRYSTSASNKAEELCRLATKKVYDTINYKVGIRLYPVVQYRIAVAPKALYMEPYVMRKQFEEALAAEAKYLCENGDSARYSRANFETLQTSKLSAEERIRNLV